MVGRSFLPNEDQGEFEMTVDAPEGHITCRAWRRLVVGDAATARGRAGIAHVVPTIFERVNHSHLLIGLKPLEERSKSQEQIAMAARAGDDRHTRPTGRRCVFKTPIGGGESSAWPILAILYGPDLQKLSTYCAAAQRSAAVDAAVHRRRRRG